MQELKTCPFCDVEMRVGNYGETLRRLEIPSDDSFSISHVDEKLAIEKKCPLAIEFFNSREEAIEAWNTRTEREFRIVEYEIGGTRYIPERTCRFEGAPDEPPTCSACGFETGIYDCDWYDDEPKYVYAGKYCPNCGAKVVSE